MKKWLKNTMSSYYRQQLENWLKTIDVNAKNVLDIGGAQLPVKDRVRTWNVLNYKILDLPNPHQGNSPDIVMDINEPHFPYDFSRTFNVIFCLEVMEYVYNPMQMINNISQFITPGGILYISFPYIYPIHEPCENDYLRYTRKGGEKLLHGNNFEIIDVIPRTEKSGLKIMDWFLAEKMRPTKNYSGHNEIGYLIKAKSLI